MTVRFQHGSTEIVTGIEATDQQRPMDSGWVEKMVGKHRDLATDKLVLYSASGFSNSAHHIAKINNVTLIKKRDIATGSAFDRVADTALGNIYVESVFYEVRGKRPTFWARSADDQMMIEVRNTPMTAPALDPSGMPLNQIRIIDAFEALIGIHRGQIYRDFGPPDGVDEKVVRLSFKPPLVTPQGGDRPAELHVRGNDHLKQSRIWRLHRMEMDIRIRVVKRGGTAHMADFSGATVGDVTFDVEGQEYMVLVGGTHDAPITSVLHPDGEVVTFKGRGAATEPTDEMPSAGTG